jgi:hypothetical protein
MRNTAYLLLALLVLLGPVAAQTPDPYSYQILYTGRTLGYARIPDEQTLPPSPSSVTNASPIAKEFLEQFDLASKNPQFPQFRIAMGDNFSPDLYGRSIHVDRSIPVPSCDGTPNGFYSSAIHLPKDYFRYSNGGWYIWCHLQNPLIRVPFTDNVADFLIRARYDTVVPGKHDFYFGPQYLRQVAGYLGKNGVQMLGENIIMTSSLAPAPMNAHPRIPERLVQPCHWNTGKDHECYHTDFGPASLDLPDNVLPWKRQFLLKGARSASDKGTKRLFRDDELKNKKDSEVDYDSVFIPDSIEVCAEPGPTTSSDPSKVLRPLGPCLPLVASDRICIESKDGRHRLDAPDHLKSTCKALYPDLNPNKAGIYNPDGQSASTDITFLFKNPGDHLVAGLNHMFCAKPSPDFKEAFDDPSVPSCQLFPVQVPMFWPNSEELDRPAPGMAACGDDPSLPCPYALVPRDNFEVAIFAVVDPDLLSNVGMLNTGWLNTKNEKWDTVAQITAPDYALLQTLELCNATKDCRKAPKILMAQMSYARATQLISNSKFSDVFDVVITQASPEHDTGNIDNRYQGKMPRFVLTPPEPLPPHSLTFVPQLYVATITKEKPPQAAPANAQAATAVDPWWSLRNISAHRLASGSQPCPRRPVCPGNHPDCVDLERLAKQYLARHHLDKTAQDKPLTDPAASDPLTQAVLGRVNTT